MLRAACLLSCCVHRLVKYEALPFFRYPDPGTGCRPPSLWSGFNGPMEACWQEWPYVRRFLSLGLKLTWTVRGPCPMMNTLANHGFLPHDGKNLTREVVVNGLSAGLNFNASLGSLMFDMALIANPEPNATFFALYEMLYCTRFGM